MTEPTQESKALARAQEIADDVFHPDALAVDAAGEVPAGHLDLLANEGFYGLAAPPPFNTLDIPDMLTACRVVEALAGGCLATTFVWAQHHSAVMGVTHSQREEVREAWLGPLCRGERRAGLSLSAAVRPGPPALRAVPAADGGYVFTGDAPWVSGWGHIDTVYMAARDDDDRLVWALIPAQAGETVTVEPLRLGAVDATRTVHLHLDGHAVAADRIVGTVPLAQWRERDPATLRFNGSFALGLIARCLRELPAGRLAAQFEACRTGLDTATPETLPAARAAAAELALRAAAALTVEHGSRSIRLDDHAQRLLREAMFLLVFGSRPGIRDSLRGLLDHDPSGH
jgi:alkylation response protein AidB-like acyl-CoA dehydrogenase